MRPPPAAMVLTRAPSRTGTCRPTPGAEFSGSWVADAVRRSSCSSADCRDRSFACSTMLDSRWRPNAARTDALHPALDLDSQRRRVGAGCLPKDCDDGPTALVSRSAYRRGWQPRTYALAGSPRARDHKLSGECIGDRRD